MTGLAGLLAAEAGLRVQKLSLWQQKLHTVFSPCVLSAAPAHPTDSRNPTCHVRCERGGQEAGSGLGRRATWTATMPRVRLCHSTADQPAARSMRASSAWAGQLTMDSAR